MSLCRIARCRLNYPHFTSDHSGLSIKRSSMNHARTLCPGVAQFCTGMSRIATHVHGGAMVLSRSDTFHPG